jgi:hypothetical protein
MWHLNVWQSCFSGLLGREQTDQEGFCNEVRQQGGLLETG